MEDEEDQGEANFEGDEESDGEFMYVDDAFIEEMDNEQIEGQDDAGSDFKTMKESDFDENEAN